MWWLNYRGRFGNIQQLTGQSESWLLFFWYAGFSGFFFFFFYIYTFLALAEKVPQSVTHKWWVIFGLFLTVESYLFKSCTSVMVTAMQVEQRDCRRESLHWRKHEQRLDTNPGTTLMLNQMCTCTSRLVGLERTDVILTAQLLCRHSQPCVQPVSHQPAPVKSYLKTLLQHGELTKLKSQSNLYCRKSHFARRQK